MTTQKEFRKFFLVGLLTFLSDASTYYFFTSAGLDLNLAKGISFLIGTLIGYLLNTIYTFEYNNETIEYQLKDGESIIFDPDLVKHGMKNKSKTKTRYALVQVFKAYPVTEWMKNFINKKETVIL